MLLLNVGICITLPLKTLFLIIFCLKRKAIHMTEKCGDDHIKFRSMKILVEQGVSVGFRSNHK